MPVKFSVSKGVTCRDFGPRLSLKMLGLFIVAIMRALDLFSKRHVRPYR